MKFLKFKTFPFEMQYDSSDCGPTCLRMICKWYGKNVPLHILKIKSNMTKQGVKAKFKKIPTASAEEREWVSNLSWGNKKVGLPDYVYPASRFVPLEKGFIVVRRKKYTWNCEKFSEGDYFTWDLKPLGKVMLPCFSLIYFSQSGFLHYVKKYFRNGYLFLIREDENEEKIYLERWDVDEF